MDDDPPIPVFIPALVVILANKEEAKGSPLTQEEVMAIRDGGVCVMIPQSGAINVTRERGYDDIDPEFAWEQWQEVRATLSGKQDPA